MSGMTVLSRLARLAPVLFLAGCALTTISHDTGPRPAAADGLVGYFTCLRNQRQLIVSAHRGAPAAGVAENTLEAYAAMAGRRDILAETDVRTTRDGHLILSHDVSLDRSTTLTGLVSDRDWPEIRSAWTRTMHGETTSHHPATLSQLLEALRFGPVLQLDLKAGVSIQAVMDAVEAAHAQDRVIYLAYTDADIAAIVQRQPDATVSTVIPSEADLDQRLRLGIRSNHLQAMFFESAVDPALFARLRARGVSVLVAASQAEEDAQHVSRPLPPERYAAIRDAGAQILVTNYPAAARAALEDRNFGTMWSAPMASTGCGTTVLSV
jgi:glycerophosphoryl diester phosphodiesterase